MSRCKREMSYKPMSTCGIGFGGFGGGGNCCCNFPTLIILILIVLQFAKKKGNRHDDCDDEYEGGGWGDQIGNGILFIIALYFLSCCNPCKTSY
jgi:hypothetical protein